MSKTFSPPSEEEEHLSLGEHFMFDPIFTSGICILPNICDRGIEISEALHINAGRLLCKYLAEEWDFSYHFDNEQACDASMLKRIRPGMP